MSKKSLWGKLVDALKNFGPLPKEDTTTTNEQPDIRMYSNGGFVVLPLFVIEMMDAAWQLEFLARLEQLDAAADWGPEVGHYYVQVRTPDGRFTSPR